MKTTLCTSFVLFFFKGPVSFLEWSVNWSQNNSFKKLTLHIPIVWYIGNKFKENLEMGNSLNTGKEMNANWVSRKLSGVRL